MYIFFKDPLKWFYRGKVYSKFGKNRIEIVTAIYEGMAFLGVGVLKIRL